MAGTKALPSLDSHFKNDEGAGNTQLRPLVGALVLHETWQCAAMHPSTGGTEQPSPLLVVSASRERFCECLFDHPGQLTVRRWLL